MSEQERNNLDGGEQDPQTNPATGDGPGQGDSDPENNGDGEEVTFTAEQQAKLDQIITNRLQRQREKLEAEAEEAQRKAEQEAEEARLAEQQEFQELAEKRKAELDKVKPELEALQERAKRYEEALESHAAQALEHVPDFVKPLLEKMDLLEKLNYIAEHAEEFAGNGGPAGPPKTPKPNGDGNLTDDERRRKSVHVRRIWS